VATKEDPSRQKISLRLVPVFVQPIEHASFPAAAWSETRPSKITHQFMHETTLVGSDVVHEFVEDRRNGGGRTHSTIQRRSRGSSVSYDNIDFYGVAKCQQEEPDDSHLL
jgi:hypothetical protein